MDEREPPENLTQLCRLCASNDDVQINIFSDKGRDKQLVEKIFSCLSVKILQSDKLPNSVCYKCMTCLENYYDFRCKCLSVITKLEQLSNLKANNEQSAAVQVKKEPSDHHEIQSMQPTDYSKARLPESESSDPAVCGSQDAYKFTCQECGEAFMNPNELLVHSKTQCRESGDPATSPSNPDRPFRCELCHKSYMLSKHLWGHMSTVHRGHPSVFCKPCSRTFSSPVNLIEHQRSKHGVPGLSSVLPNTQNIQSNNVSNSENRTRSTTDSQSSQSPLRKILNSESRKRSIDEVSGSRRKNSMPRKISRTAEEEARDAREAKSEQNHFLYPDSSNLTAYSSSSTSSTVTSQSFQNSSLISNYRNSLPPSTNISISSKANSSVNGNTNSYSNSVPSNTHCNTQPQSHPPSKSKIVSNASNQHSALIRVGPNKGLMCLLCEKKFTKRPHLNKHIRNVHGIDTTEVTLGKISKSMADEDIENMMEAETVFCCEICTREFNDRSSMWLHMLHAHKREAGLACGLCLKICPDRTRLSEHLETHLNDGTDQKRFCCSFCGRQDDARPKLIKHANVHGPTVNTIEIVIPNPRYHTHINHAAKNTVNTVAPPGSISCQICYRIFADEEKLIKHCQNAHKSLSLLDHTNNLIFSCEICTTSFSSRSERWTHIFKNHTTDTRVACPVKTCKKVFSSQALKTAHAATHHQEQGDYPNVCEMCGKLFQQRSEFYKHMMGVHPHTLPFVCGVCLKIVCSIDELKAHVREEHEPLPELEEQIRCDICARPYLKHSKMVRHRAMHNDGTEAPKMTRRLLEKPEPLNCALCPDAVFETIEILSEHRRKDHNLMVCDLCPKFYAKCSHLWKHVHRCHTNHPDVTCKLCGKTSASRIHLKRHIAKLHKDSDLYNPADDPHYHGEDYPHMAASGPHSCEKCKRVFRKYNLLHKHFKHCSGPRPPLTPIPAMVDGVYPCSKCTKSFILPTALRKHIRTAHIPQVCELCPEMSYDTKQELMDHVREKHIKDPLLKCQVDGCSRLFRLKIDAERHKKEHVSKYFAHLCNFCGDVFTNRKKLRKHLKSNHKQQTQFLCYVCFEPEATLELLAEHVQASHKPLLKLFVCQLCGKNHPSSSKANEHIKAIHGSEYKPCPICWKIFTDKSKLDSHVENHPQETAMEKSEPVKKTAAKRPSNSNSKINKELAALTENSFDFLSSSKLGEEGSSNEVSKRLRRMFCCISCTQSFRVVNDLINHRASVHGEYCCSSCAKQFILEMDFEDHVKICEALEEGFVMGGTEKPKDETPISTPSSVERRKVWASFDVETPCELCDKRWTGLKHYWQHLIRSHKEVAPFACGVCLKLCTDYEDLAYHLDEKHLGTFTSKGNNFVCRVCGRYHNAQGKLQIHMSVHTGRSNVGTIPSIRCRQCELIFKTQKFFDEHMDKDHEGVDADGMPSSDVEEDIEHIDIKDEIDIDDDIEEVESDAEVSGSKKNDDDDDDDEDAENDIEAEDVETHELKKENDEDDDDEDDDEDDIEDDIEAEDVDSESKKNDDDDDDDDEEDDDEDVDEDVENDDIEAEDVDIDDDDEEDDEDEIDELDDAINPDEDQTTENSRFDTKAVDPLAKNEVSSDSINYMSPSEQIKLKELKLVVPNLKINCGKLSSSFEKDSKSSGLAEQDDACQPESEINVPNYSEASPCIS